MLGNVSFAPRALSDYEPLIGAAAVEEVHRRAAPLHGLRLLNLTVTAFGTWHTDLLSAAVPLLQDLGVEASWGIVRPPQQFEPVVRQLYAALSGGAASWNHDLQREWMQFSDAVRPLLEPGYDVVVVHDPQLLGLAPSPDSSVNGRRVSWVWHSHLDLGGADSAALHTVLGCVDRYDGVIFEDPAFVPAQLHGRRVAIIPPGLDPLGPRNVALDRATAEMLVSRLGVDAGRPVIAQISPMTPGSDALGLIEAFDALKPKHPDLQLVLVPTSVREDQSTHVYYEAVSRLARDRRDCMLVPVAAEVGNAELNALQLVSSVVLQKSLERGYALWLSEAMWKQRPVVAGRTAGTVAQIIDGVTGYLVPDTQRCIERLDELLRDADLRHRLGEAGRVHVTEHFLVTRYLTSVLEQVAGLVGARGRV